MNIFLWVIQILLAMLFVYAGSMKFIMSVAEMTEATPWMSGDFLHFIGACEIQGGWGLVLPRPLKIKPSLTPLAAALLTIHHGRRGGDCAAYGGSDGGPAGYHGYTVRVRRLRTMESRA